MTKVYCAAPWRGLHITTGGDVKPCCSGAHGFGNINTDNIEEVLNSVSWQKLREQIAQGNKPDYCATCISHGDSSQNERSWHNTVTPDINSLNNDYHSPAILDVRWSNACNLMCVYCNPNDSSMWARKLDIPLQTKRKDYYKNVVDYIDSHRQNLKVVALIGGEPLLIPQCADLLDSVPDTVEIHVISNLSLNLENNSVFRRLAQRTKVHWSVSFENVGKQFEFVRRGASWNQLTRNLDMLLELERTQGHVIDIHAILNILSLSNFKDLTDFGFEKRIQIIFQFLDTPPALDLRRFPIHILDIIRAQVESVYKEIDTRWCEHNTIDQYFASAHNEEPDQISNFYKFVNECSTEDLKFNQLWPELDQLLRQIP